MDKSGFVDHDFITCSIGQPSYYYFKTGTERDNTFGKVVFRHFDDYYFFII